MGFTKLDSGLAQSSLMTVEDFAFKVFMILLSQAGPDGIARVSSVYIGSICHRSIEDVAAALAILEAPDPHSRSKKSRGARIKRVDGGYFLVNYHQYRERGYSASDEAARKREYRAKISTKSLGENGTLSGQMGHCPQKQKQKQKKKQKKNPPTPFTKGGQTPAERRRKEYLAKRVGHGGDVTAGNARAHERNLKAFPELLGKTERHAKRKGTS